MPPAKPTPITFCITELCLGGAERMLVELACRLDRERFLPQVIALGSESRPGQEELCERLHAADVPVHFLDGRTGRDVSRIKRKLIALLKEQQPEILQTFLWHANTLGALAARRAGVRHCIAGIRVAEPRRPWRNLVSRLLARRVSHHVCVSQGVMRFALRRMRLPADRMSVIPNGVDIAALTDVAPANLADFGVPPDRKVILFVGRLEKQKGADRLLQTASPLLKKLPDHDLLLVGHGSLEPSLKWQAAQSPLAERIHFAGFSHEVPKLLAASDLVVLPSRYEGMPNIVLEAMASSRPVVMTAVEGSGELFGSRESVQLVPPGNLLELERAMVRIAGDRALAAELGQENRRRAERNLSLDLMVSAYADIYTALIEGGGTSGEPDLTVYQPSSSESAPASSSG